MVSTMKMKEWSGKKLGKLQWQERKVQHARVQLWHLPRYNIKGQNNISKIGATIIKTGTSVFACKIEYAIDSYKMKPERCA